MHRRDSVQSRIDFRHKGAEVQLFRKLSGVEISHCCRFDLRRIDLRVIDRLTSRFGDEVPDRLPFLLQVALKIGPAAAENTGSFIRSFALANHRSLSSRAQDVTKNFTSRREGQALSLRLSRRSHKAFSDSGNFDPEIPVITITSVNVLKPAKPPGGAR